MKKRATQFSVRQLNNTLWYCLMALFLFSSGLSAQGWQQTVGSQNPEEEGWSLVEDIDGGYLVLGTGVDPDGDSDQDIYLFKFDIDGVFVWSRYIDNGGTQLPKAIQATPDGNYLIVGSIMADNGVEDVQLLKITPQGETIWSRDYGGDISEIANDVVVLDNGDFAIVGRNDAGPDIESDILVVRFDQLGNARWQKTFGTDRSDEGNAIVAHPSGFFVVGDSKNEEGFDNDIVIFNLDENGDEVWERRLANNFREEGKDIVNTLDGGFAIAGVINNRADAFVAKFDMAGNQLWSRTLGTSENEEEANSIVELADGSLVVAGLQVQSSGFNADMYLVKLNSDGSPLWERSIGQSDFLDEARALVTTLDGGFALAGYNGFGLSFQNDITLVKTDALGNTFTNLITGRVYHDLDQGCDVDNGEPGLGNWLVIAEGATQTFYGTTNEEGIYNITVDTGTYIVNLIPENRYWRTCEVNGYPIGFQEFYDTVTVEMGATSNVECPYLEVDISAPYLVRCDNVVYTVEYCNLGTATAVDAVVEVLLDNQLSFVDADLPNQVQEEKLIFNIGDIPAGECGSFEITAQSACTGIAKNQAVLVQAEIFPDTICLTPNPNWDGSELEVEGLCETGGDILFRVKNVGINKMLAPQRTVVTEEAVIFSVGEVQLDAKEETLIRVPLGSRDGSTYRLIADQSPDHPFKTFATAFVEGCETLLGDNQTGFATQFPEDDDAPTVSKDVQEIIDTLPLVELRAYPKGYEDGIIDQSTNLTYKFLMSNTGTDVVDRIVIRDTLSSFVDLSTLQMGASSHPYSFEVYNEGILKITFENLQLAPNGTNETDELVFVEFKIAQLADNPVGTEIFNRATIFYDYQEPIVSNLVRHIVDQYPDFIEVVVDTDQEFLPGVELSIYPNPFKHNVRFKINNGNKTFSQLKFRVFDSTGRLIDQQLYSGNQFDYFRTSKLEEGIYFFRLESEGQLISSGKLMVQ